MPSSLKLFPEQFRTAKSIPHYVLSSKWSNIPYFKYYDFNKRVFLNNDNNQNRQEICSLFKTIKIGKRSISSLYNIVQNKKKKEANPFSTMRFGKRNEQNPLGMMRFGKRQIKENNPIRFEKRNKNLASNLIYCKDYN